MSAHQPAIFIDRDGTLNIDHGYVSAIDDFQFIPGTIEALAQLQKQYLLVLVTNQSGIARGKFSEQQFLQLTEWMDWSLADRGVDLAGIYYCPHHPTAGIGDYLQACLCRKPHPGMLLTAQQQLKIDMANSIMIGDTLADIQAGRAAGVGHCYLVRTGKPLDATIEQQADAVLASLADLPDYLSSRG